VSGNLMEKPHDCVTGDDFQDHSDKHIQRLPNSPTCRDFSAMPDHPGAIRSEKIPVLNRPSVPMARLRSSEATEISDNTAAGARLSNSNTERTGTANFGVLDSAPAEPPGINLGRFPSFFGSRFRSTTAAFWHMVKQGSTQKDPLTQRDVDTQPQHFKNIGNVQPLFANHSLSTLQNSLTQADDNADLAFFSSASPINAGDVLVSTDASSFTPPPAVIADDTTATSFHPPSDECKQCWLFYPWAHVYYPPAETSNTECLTALTAAPAPNLPPLELDPKPGYAYVVLPEVSAEMDCKIFTTYTSQTFSFAPHMLSTMQGPQNLTKEFNFGDLPCPPAELASEVQWFYNPAYNPTRRYSPFIAPFSELWDIDPLFKALPCTVALNQGMDPPSLLPTASAPTRPTKGPRRPGRLARYRRDAVEEAHRVINLPIETDPPPITR
ncbi:MAG: hypothetical protein Q9204_005622, partial [Flavoplaca sp. TL-2023a]